MQLCHGPMLHLCKRAPVLFLYKQVLPLVRSVGLLLYEKQASDLNIPGNTQAYYHTLCQCWSCHFDAHRERYNGSSCLCSISISDRENVIAPGLN